MVKSGRVPLSITIIKVVKMFQTGQSTTTRGYTAGEAVAKLAPDGRRIVEFTLGVGDGSKKYPTMWTKIVVWEKLAELAENVIDRKGICVEAKGMLHYWLYDGKRGKQVTSVLKNVRELRIYDRYGELVQVLSGESKE